MREPDDNEIAQDEGAPSEVSDAPDLELQLLVLVDTLLALSSMARIELRRSILTLPKWFVLGFARVPLWLFFWLSLSALVSYAAYAASGGSMGIALTALLLLQGAACLLLEVGLNVLWRRLSFTQTRQALRECIETRAAARSAKVSEKQT
jgi:hypothetical protein